MGIFRIQDKTPEVYTSESRDFQLIGRIFDCLVNGIKFDVDSINHIIDTGSIDNRLLSMLQTKLGFFSDKMITDRDLRYVLSAFPIIIKNKGSITGIKQAVQVFLKLNNIESEIDIRVINNELYKPYTVQIGLNYSIEDTTLLDEILKYILPCGYNVEYVVNKKFSQDDTQTVLKTNIDANILIVKDSVNSMLRGNYIAYLNKVEDDLIGTVGVVQTNTPYSIDFKGFIKSYSELPDYSSDISKDSHVGECYCVFNLNTGLDDSYVFLKTYNGTEFEYAWEKLIKNTNYGSFDTYKYCIVEEDGIIDTSYIKDTSYTVRDDSIKIENTDPYNAILSIDNTINKFYDEYSNDIWFVSQSDNQWSRINTLSKSILINGDPNDANGIKLPTIEYGIALRNAGPSIDIYESIWICKPFNNEFKWVEVSQFDDKYNEYKYNKTITITGDPDNAVITDIYGKYIYLNDISNKILYIKNTTSTSNWKVLYNYGELIRINGSPITGTYIYPEDLYKNNTNTGLYNSSINYSWKANVIKSSLNTLDEHTLYIDSRTSDGYYFNGSYLDQVIYYARVANIYEIKEDELQHLVETDQIRPIFKDDVTIFRDSLGNILLY